MAFDVKRLATQFDVVNGYLAIRNVLADGQAMVPIEVGARLCYEAGRKIVLLKELKDLTNLVRITSPAAAVSYLRLGASPTTYGFLSGFGGRNSLEVVDRASVTDSFVFGDHDLVASLRKAPDGYYAIVGGRFFAKWHLPSTQCVRMGMSFRCTRTIYLAPASWMVRTGNLMRLTQMVDANGAVRTESMIALPEQICRSVQWLPPRFQ